MYLDMNGMEDTTRAEGMKNGVSKEDKYGEVGLRGVMGSGAKVSNLQFAGWDERFLEGFDLKASGKQAGR